MDFRHTFMLAGVGGAGVLFGAGLVISGMTQPSKVLGFLDIAAAWYGAWDATLMFVLAGAVITTFVGYRWVWRCKKPLCGTEFKFPKASSLDFKLVVGSALFGIGWGLAGYCPGPALVNLLHPTMDTLAFLAAMLVGMVSGKFLARGK